MKTSAISLHEHAHDVSDAHRLLRHDPENPPDRLRAVVEQVDSQTAVLRVNHIRGTSAQMRAYNAVAVLNQLLSHYPIPAYVNGVPVERTPFNTEPSIHLIANYPAIMADDCRSSRCIETISGPEAQSHHRDSAILVDGVTYALAVPTTLLERRHGQSMNDVWLHQPTRMNFTCTDPEPPHPHVNVLQHYGVRFNFTLATNADPKQDDTRFACIHGGYYCLPDPEHIPCLEASAGLALDVMRQHAERTGRNILSQHPRSHPSWHHGYEQQGILLDKNTTPATMADSVSPSVAHSVARALYRNPEPGVVLVDRTADTNYRLTPRQVLYVDSDSGYHTTTRYKDLEAQRFDHDAPPCVKVTELTLLADLLKNDRFDRHVAIPLGRLALGWVGLPRVMVNMDFRQHLGHMACDLANAYHDQRREDEGSSYDIILEHMQVLAKRCLDGDYQAFLLELQRLTDRFLPNSDVPNHPVVMAATDGRHTITWEPGKRGEPLKPGEFTAGTPDLPFA